MATRQRHSQDSCSLSHREHDPTGTARPDTRPRKPLRPRHPDSHQDTLWHLGRRRSRRLRPQAIPTTGRIPTSVVRSELHRNTRNPRRGTTHCNSLIQKYKDLHPRVADRTFTVMSTYLRDRESNRPSQYAKLRPQHSALRGHTYTNTEAPRSSNRRRKPCIRPPR